MRIAWYSHRYFPCVGGSEKFGRSMVSRFVAEGHDVDVLTSNAHDLWYFTDRRRRRVDEPFESRVDGARVRRFAVHHFPGQRYMGRLLSYVPHWPTQCRWSSYMPRIPQLERARGSYDVVFAVGFPYTVFSFAAFQTARAAGASLILSPFLHLATPGDPVRRYYTRPHQIRLLAEADTVLVQTDIEADAVRGWGIPDDRIFKLGMAVDLPEVTGGKGQRLRERLGIAAHHAVVGQLGALDPNKGTTDVIRAIERLNADRPASDPIHLILGGAPSPDFEAFAAQLDPATARWLHRVGSTLPASEVPDFYDALDIFAMPSRTDSFGIVFLEAWANAKPVVAAAAGGVAEVVRHNETGLLVPFGDLDRLASAIQKLVNDPAEARRLGQTGRSHLQTQHTWDNRYEVLRDWTLDVITRRQDRALQPATV